MAKRGMSDDERDEFLRARPKRAEREDLDEESFDLERYGIEFDLEEELKRPVTEEPMAKKKAKKKVVKKKTVKKAVKKKSAKKPSPTAAELIRDTTPVQSTPPAPKPAEEIGTTQPYEPQYYTPEEEDSGWWVAVLIILILVASGVVYRYAQSQAPPTGEQCTLAYLDSTEGYIIDADTMTGAARLWTNEALTSADGWFASSVFNMLACLGDDVTKDSDPAGVQCSRQPAQVVVSDSALTRLIEGARIETCERIGDELSCGEFTLDAESWELVSGELSSVRTQEQSKVFGNLQAPAATLFETISGTRAIITPLESHDATVVRLFAGESIGDLRLRYVTQNPRLVTWDLP